MKATRSVRIRRSSHRRSIVLRAVVIALCGVTLAIGFSAPPAEGCGWSGFERSLRFSSSSVNKDRLPPLPRSDPRNEWTEDVENFWGFYEEEGCCDGLDETGERFDAAREHFGNALMLVEEDDIRGARKLFERYLDESGRLMREDVDSYYAAPHQPLRNQAMDLVDVLGEHDHGVSVAAIQHYARIRTRDFSEDTSPNGWIQLANVAAHEPRIADNVAYLDGVYLFRRSRFNEAAEAFDRLISRWPKSEKREAAVYMSGVSWLRYAEQPDESCYLKEAHAVAASTAQRRFETLLRTHPHGAFTKDARGWLARVAIESYDTPTGLVAYYTMLRRDADLSERLEGARSLNLVRPRATTEDMLEVERRLERDPEAALAYAYYEIYNEGAWSDGFDDELESPPDTNNPYVRSQFERIVAFASKMADRFPKGAVGAGFAVRVAGASLELDRNADAVKFATRALAAGPTAREKHDALYLLATAEHGARHFAEARTAIDQLLASKPDQRMEESARRRLAMVCEDDSDLAGALDQYRALKYEADASYLIDTLMTIDDLTKYIAARPSDPDIDWLRYALGVRLLRVGQYAGARIEFMRVRTASPQHDDWSARYRFESAESEEAVRPAKDPAGFDSRDRRPRREWVAADMQTADELIALESAANRVAGAEDTAEARYQVAAYLFDHQALLFYNPSLWWGSRADCFAGMEHGDVFRLPGEGERVWNSTRDHDALARSVDAFLDVVDMYPETRAAADAMYSAAVAHERLAEFNGYWRDQYASGRFAGRRLVTYEDVRKAYPGYRFPKGTFGWEASTRTVNGGPGRDPLPPKPKPVPVWRRYATRVSEIVGNGVSVVVHGIVPILRRAGERTVQTVLLLTMLFAWIAAVRSSLKLALDTIKGNARAKALLPASSAYRPRDHAWIAQAVDWFGIRRRLADTGLSIMQRGSTQPAGAVEPRLDDRVILFIERTRLFLATKPEALALVLVVVTHVPMLLFVAMALS